MARASGRKYLIKSKNTDISEKKSREDVHWGQAVGQSDMGMLALHSFFLGVDILRWVRQSA